MKGCPLALAVAPVAAAAFVAVFFVVLLVTKLLWSWVVPDLFPGAVEQGLIARELSWMGAFKVALVTALVTGAAKGGRS